MHTDVFALVNKVAILQLDFKEVPKDYLMFFPLDWEGDVKLIDLELEYEQQYISFLFMDHWIFRIKIQYQ